MMRAIVTVSILTVLLPCMAFADVPAAFSYQGILADSLGEPVEDDVYAIQFRIYEDSVTVTPLWESSGFIPKQTANGLFSHVMGSTNPLPDSLSRYGNLWVGITVDLDDEMMPRTALTSVPFALSTQYADTAEISLDKTINASELTEGTLDTARYSAYEDLMSEDKIGYAPDQVPSGDHLHTGVSFPGTMVRYEDTTAVVIDVIPVTDTLAKTMTIPSGQISAYFQVVLSWAYSYNTPGATAILNFKAGNQLIFSYNESFGGGNGYRVRMAEYTFLKIQDNIWAVKLEVEGYTNTIYVAINPSSGLTLDVEVSSSGSPDVSTIIGNLLVEYDVD